MLGKQHVLESPEKDFHCYTKFVDKKVRFVWKINGFTTRCPSEIGVKLKSSNFNIPGDAANWHLELYPNGKKSNEGYISLFLYSNSKEKVSIRCEFSLIDVSGEKSKKISFSKNDSFFEGYGLPQFLLQSYLLEHETDLLPNDELTVSCIATKQTEAVSKCITTLLPDPSMGDSEVSTLTEDWRRCYDSDKNTDVLLKVGRKNIAAHKLVLACRSPVFASMFEHNMVEKNTSKVVVTDVEFDVLKELVRFMYTDMITLENFDFTIKLLVAADKYGVSSLKARCVRYLAANVSASSVFQVLEVAHACNEEGLLQRCTSLIEGEMSSVTLADWISDLNERPNLLPVIQKLLKKRKRSEVDSD